MLEYSLKSVEIESAGTGYAVNDVLTIDLDTDDAKLKVTGVTEGAITSVVITDAGESTTSTVENPVSVTGGTGSGAKFNITLAAVFEEVEVTDVPGTMPKPATEVSYVSYSVSYPELPIDYNTAFTREYPVQENEESGEESDNA